MNLKTAMKLTEIPDYSAIPLKERSPLKRSEINRSIGLAIETVAGFGICLPPFAFWTIEEWDRKPQGVAEIRDCMLGWDVTDFGSGCFDFIGRTLFTLRNGRHSNPNYPKCYAEKLILDPEGQRAPAHFHQSKREDLINRAGGNILVKLTRATAANTPSNESLTVQVDGQTVKVDAGGIVRLHPGQSICIPPRTIHQFWGEEGTGITVSSEVSSVSDDWSDNFFLEEMCRFPKIEEDEPRRYYLCHEYPP